VWVGGGGEYKTFKHILYYTIEDKKVLAILTLGGLVPMSHTIIFQVLKHEVSGPIVDKSNAMNTLDLDIIQDCVLWEESPRGFHRGLLENIKRNSNNCRKYFASEILSYLHPYY